ncbi:hypothetical protein ACI78T_18190 [Blastococcus sp. SYSU D00922]
MHAHLSDVAFTAHRSDLLAEGAVWREASRPGPYVRVPRWLGLTAERFAAWAERPRAGRTAGVCCPA